MKYANSSKPFMLRQVLAYSQLYNKTELRKGEIAKAFGISPKQEQNLFFRLIRAGLISRVKSGLYLVPKRVPAGGGWRPGEYLALSRLMAELQATYQICGPNAFYLYGFDDQVPQITYVYNNRLSGEKTVAGMPFVFIKVADLRLGATSSFETPDGVTTIYSSKVRTLFDAVYNWSRFGGIPRGYDWIRNELKKDPAILKQLIDVTLKFGNQGTIRRIGYLLESSGVEIRRLRPLRKMLRSSAALIPWIPKNPARGRISKEWRVIVNSTSLV